MAIFALWGVVQAQISDDFSDGDFTANPTWFGDTNDFVVADFRLRLNAPPDAQVAALVSPIPQVDSVGWSFRAGLFFNPSSANYAVFWLLTDRPSCDERASGYAVWLGGNSEDQIRLMRKSGELGWTTIIASPEDYLTADSIDVQVSVERNSAGCWTLSAGTDEWGPICDTSYRYAGWAGWQCVFTATRADRFVLDDVEVHGLFYSDTVAPSLLQVQLLDSAEFLLEGSEPLYIDEVYWWEHWSGPALDTLYIANNQTQLAGRLYEPLESGDTLNAALLHVTDASGNAEPSIPIQAAYYQPAPGDLLLSEIMADPVPSVGLPEVEYVELWNASEHALNLADFQLGVGEVMRPLPKYNVLPGEFVLLTDEGSLAYSSLPHRVEISLPSLPNSGGRVSLSFLDGQISDILSYDLSTYRIPYKEDGGWSLERGFFGRSDCFHTRWWSASEDSDFGGTPGGSNAVVMDGVDAEAPNIRSVGLLSDSSWVVRFSEPVQLLQPGDLGSFNPDLAGDNGANPPMVFIPAESPSEVQLVFPVGGGAGTGSVGAFEWMLPEITDCAENPLLRRSVVLGLPGNPKAGDVWINEVMFHSDADYVDYVELKNGTDAPVDLRQLGLADFDEVSGVWSTPKWISEGSWLLAPGAEVCIASDLSRVKRIPVGECWGVEASIPQLSSSGGGLVLITRGFEILDTAGFKADWHHPMLNETQGVALERVVPSLCGLYSSAWLSASTSSGYGTPGCSNSRRLSPLDHVSYLKVWPEVLNLRGTGANASLQVSISLPEGYVAELSVVNEMGYRVSTIMNTALTGSLDKIFWSGNDAMGKLLEPGRYVMVLSAWHPSEPMILSSAVFGISY